MWHLGFQVHLPGRCIFALCDNEDGKTSPRLRLGIHAPCCSASVIKRILCEQKGYWSSWLEDPGANGYVTGSNQRTSTLRVFLLPPENRNYPEIRCVLVGGLDWWFGDLNPWFLLSHPNHHWKKAEQMVNQIRVQQTGPGEYRRAL